MLVIIVFNFFFLSIRKFDYLVGRRYIFFIISGINEANLNTTDIKQSDVIPHRLTPRRNRYTYQGAQSNQITNYNPYIRDRNTEVGIMQ